MTFGKLFARRAAGRDRRRENRMLCEMLEARTLLAAPVVAGVSPLNLDVGVGISAKVAATFTEAMDIASITADTFVLSDATHPSIPARISYNSVSRTATLDVAAPLQYGTTYTATVIGGAAGVKSTTQELMAGSFSWTFTTAASPGQGTGGPTLIIMNSAFPFGGYYAEILRAEGLNSFDVKDMAVLSPSLIAPYQNIILGEMPLTQFQVTMLTDWVTNGGNLIAMKPDKQLAGLLGLRDAGTNLSNGYILVDRAQPATAGIVGQTMQYHGVADAYTPQGATVLATLYAGADTATGYVAVSMRSVGSNGGQAAAFTYDLARSIVYTRQGNPDWAGQERDGLAPIRSNDLFFGTNGQPDWVDLNKVSIPQADEQQRLLANMLTLMSADALPLPRLWYLPNGAKAAVVLTGDDHASGGTVPRFTNYQAAAPTSNAVPGWSTVRGTSYIYPGSLTDADAARFSAAGFELALHVNTGEKNFSNFGDLDQYYSTQLAQFASRYPSLPTPETQRTHAIVWSDYATQAQVELKHRIRMDTTYYYWPASWIKDRPGVFTGSAMPMRFATANGEIIDVYQAATQMTDESSQTYPFTVDALLGKATGPEGYYGFYTVNSHTQSATSPESTAVIASARAHNVPVVTTQQVLRWTDGRNGSSFGALQWDAAGRSLSFTVTAGAGAEGLQVMLPLEARGLELVEVRRGSSAVPFRTEVIKGVAYAFFDHAPSAAGAADAYTARYASDASPPVITNLSASPVREGTAIVTWKTDKLARSRVAYGTSPDALTLSATSPELADSHSVTLVNLLPGTTYYYRVVSTDTSGNEGGAPPASQPAASFTMPGAFLSVWDSTAAPTILSAADSAPVEVGMKFRSDVAGLVSGVRFYKGDGNVGTHVASLWTADGQRLASATFTHETASGWQQVSFNEPVTISANTTYIVSYFAPNGRYSATPQGLASEIVRGPLRALRDGAQGGNGVFVYASASSFPTRSFNANNYWVDVVFNESGAPSVISRTPAPGSTGVAVNTPITFKFDEPVQQTTIAFALKDQNNRAVAGTLQYDGATHTATFTPAASLSSATTYTATVSGAADLQGNVMTAPASWAFTTFISGSGPFTIWDASATPAIASASDDKPVELGVKFRSSAAGYITGIRFYKGPGNIGTHIGTLWTLTGQKLASATFTNETASGWQQVNFTTPVAIQPNVTYVASYYAPLGRYAATVGGLASAFNHAPLQALQDGTDGRNGLFLYSNTSAFPTNSFSATNYWVDVVFSAAGDVFPPEVTGKTPAAGATGIPVGTKITATFNEPVAASSVSLVLRDPSGNALAGTTSYDPATRTATLTLASALPGGTTFTATVSGAQDESGNAMFSPVSWSFTTAARNNAAYSIWDDSVVPPHPAFDPNGGIEVGVKFRSDVDGYLSGIRFYKGPGNDGPHVGNLWSADGQKLATVTFSNETATGWQQALFAAPVPIKANTTYIASYFAPRGNYAAAGNGMLKSADNPPLHALADGADGGNGVYRYSPVSTFPAFSFAAANYYVDVVFSNPAPTVTYQSPAPDSFDIPINSPVTVIFNEPIQPSTVSFALRGLDNSIVPAKVSYYAPTQALQLVPSAPLIPGLIYTVTLGGAQDLGGTPMAAALTWTFRTALPYTLFASSLVPGIVDAPDSSPVELGMRFQSDRAGYVSGVRFYKGPGNTGTHTGNLWSSTGQLLASATFVDESASGWQTAYFAKPVLISPNVTYVVSYFAPNGHYSLTRNGLSSTVNRAPLHGLGSGVDGGNGVFRYGNSSGFPSQSGSGSNYFVDVVFSMLPPTVAAFTPAHNSSTVPIGSTITATFSEPVREETISFVLSDQSGRIVPATLSYDSGSNTATLTPSAPLERAKRYVVVVSGARNMWDLPMLHPVSWTFSAMGSFTIFSPQALPSTPSQPDPNPIELGLRFKSDVAGVVRGVRFYKGSLNTGTHTGNLWSSTGQLLASAVFANETATGWQEVLFATPVAIQPNTVYVVSYFAPRGGYAATAFAMTDGADRAPLHAMKSGPDGGNGVYVYTSASAFPYNSWVATNYWVDVVFDDTTAPTITARTPAPGATGVPLAAGISVTFSESVDPGSVNSGTIILRQGNTVVPATLVYDAATRTARLTPVASLLAARTYSVSVKGGAGGVRDLIGNPLAADADWTFATA